MRHQRTGKKLGRDSAHRKALYANLTCALIEHGRIKTTVTKAKAVKPIAEQMITLGRRGDLHARRQAVAVLRSKDIVHKLFSDVGPRYRRPPGRLLADRQLGPRPGDAAEMVYLELVDTPLVFRAAARRVAEAAATTWHAEPVVEEEPEAEAAAEPEAEKQKPSRRPTTRRSPRQRASRTLKRSRLQSPSRKRPSLRVWKPSASP